MIRRAKLLIGLLVSFSLTLSAQLVPGKVKSFHREGNEVLIKCEDKLQVKLSVLSEDLLRLQMAPDGVFNTSMMVEWGYVKEEWPETNFEIDNSKEEMVITTAALKVIISKDAFRIRVEDLEGKLLIQESQSKRTRIGEGNLLSFDMPADEHFFGFGFMRTTLDARGSKLTWTRG